MSSLILFFFLLATDTGSGTVVTLSVEEVQRAGIATSAVTVAAYRPELRVVGEIVRAPGATHPVRTLVEARVEKLSVSPGDRVVVGQQLMVLHAHQLHVLQSRLLAAIQGFRLAENRLEAGRQLLEIEGIARIEVERREQEVLRARLEVLQARIELHELDLTDEEIDALADVDPVLDEMHTLLPLRASVSGVVLEAPIAEGTWVEPFEELLLIGDPERLELALQITPAAAASIQVGDLLDFRPVGQDGCRCTARVITRVPQVDPETRTITIRAEILQRTASVLAGVFVEGTLRGQAQSETRLAQVPESAVVRLVEGDHVFLVLDSGRYEARSIELGRLDGDNYQVLNGLEPGDAIVSEGALLLKSKLVRGSEGEEP